MTLFSFLLGLATLLCHGGDHATVVNHVIEHGRNYEYSGSGGGGEAYEKTYYDKHSFYEVIVYHNKDGTKTLTIGYYVTNVDFDRLQTPADVVANELKMSQPRIFREYHFSDAKCDGTVDTVQRFFIRGNVVSGFTRRERDIGYSKLNRKLVSVVVFDDGTVFEDGKWREATKQEKAEAQKLFNEALSTIAGCIKKQ